MSISAEFFRIEQEKLEKLLKDPGYYLSRLYTCENIFQNSICIGTYWQKIHYLLTGEVAWPGRSFLPSPRCNIIMGGSLLDSDYDARYLTPIEVKSVVKFLEEHPISWVEKEFYNINNRPVILYNRPMEEDNLSDLLFEYGQLCSIYFEAAKVGDAILIVFNQKLYEFK